MVITGQDEQRFSYKVRIVVSLGKKGRKEENDRVLRDSRCEASIDNPKEILLMYKLGNNICAAKEDFIIAHLWYVCKHCCHPILSEKQWVCSVCKNFHICEKCFLLEQKLEKKHRHPYGKRELPLFHGAQVDNIPACTIDDDDETIQSIIFDTISMFLSHCRSDHYHYQFDTLRKAKHSTMMILYNLHNQFSPSISAGIWCWRDIEIPVGTVTDNTSQLTNQRKQEFSGAALLHTSKCVVPRCTSSHCQKLKDLFHHGTKCETRASGGCKFCRIILYILRIHAQSCAEPKCHVPQYKNWKEHLRKKQLVEDSQQKLEDRRLRTGGKQRMREDNEAENVL